METIPEFEYDLDKSAANLAKHGIDFVAAQAVFRDSAAIQIAARSNTEPRIAVVGQIGDKHWTVFVTNRGSAIRIMSARRSRSAEVKLYEVQEC